MFELYIQSEIQDGIIIKDGMKRGKVWIGKESGEGGDYNKDDLLKVLNKFYDEKGVNVSDNRSDENLERLIQETYKL